MSTEVAEGCTAEIASQMPTPVSAPTTMVISRKKRVWPRT